jgi:hypothetical protein
MAMKSKAQRRKFAALLVEGKIDPETYERWNREAGKKQLPEHVKGSKKKKAKKKATRKPAGRSTRASSAKARPSGTKKRKSRGR